VLVELVDVKLQLVARNDLWDLVNAVCRPKKHGITGVELQFKQAVVIALDHLLFHFPIKRVGVYFVVHFKFEALADLKHPTDLQVLRDFQNVLLISLEISFGLGVRIGLSIKRDDSIIAIQNPEIIIGWRCLTFLFYQGLFLELFL